MMIVSMTVLFFAPLSLALGEEGYNNSRLLIPIDFCEWGVGRFKCQQSFARLLVCTAQQTTYTYLLLFKWVLCVTEDEKSECSSFGM
jgi:hypothetical protein